MKLICAGLIILFLFACTSSKITGNSSRGKTNPVIAHRGAFKKNNFPENSIAALQEAIRLGCYGSEFDVRMTADDSLIINHDPVYNGMDIEKTDFAVLSSVKLSNGESLPTLRQYLLAGLYQNKTTKLVLEIKPSETGKERGRMIAEKVAALVQELNAAPSVVYISFDYDMLKRILELDVSASTQYLAGDKSPAQLKADRISGADYHYSVFRNKPEWIQQAKNSGIALNAWTVNDTATMNWLLHEKFEYITTNEPELLLKKSVSARR